MFSALSSIKAQNKVGRVSGSREVTAVYSSIEVFLREKLAAVAIHPLSMKLEAHLPWSFITFTSGKSRPCHIYFPLSPGLCFLSLSCSVTWWEIEEIYPKAFFALHP